MPSLGNVVSRQQKKTTTTSTETSQAQGNYGKKLQLAASAAENNNGGKKDIRYAEMKLKTFRNYVCFFSLSSMPWHMPDIVGGKLYA